MLMGDIDCVTYGYGLTVLVYAINSWHAEINDLCKTERGIYCKWHKLKMTEKCVF